CARSRLRRRLEHLRVRSEVRKDHWPRRRLRAPAYGRRRRLALSGIYQYQDRQRFERLLDRGVSPEEVAASLSERAGAASPRRPFSFGARPGRALERKPTRPRFDLGNERRQESAMT